MPSPSGREMESSRVGSLPKHRTRQSKAFGEPVTMSLQPSSPALPSSLGTEGEAGLEEARG